MELHDYYFKFLQENFLERVNNVDRNGLTI